MGIRKDFNDALEEHHRHAGRNKMAEGIAEDITNKCNLPNTLGTSILLFGIGAMALFLTNKSEIGKTISKTCARTSQRIKKQ